MVQDLNIYRARSYTLELEVTDEDTGAMRALADGEVILFGVKKDPAKDAAPLFCHAAVATAETGVYTISIKPEDTADLTPGRYYYDVGLISGGDMYPVIETSAFMLRANVTGKGDSYD